MAGSQNLHLCRKISSDCTHQLEISDSSRDSSIYVRGCLTLTLGLTVALVLAEILNVVQVFTPAQLPKLLLFVTVVQQPASRKCQKTRVKPENTWVFRGVFSGITRTWTPRRSSWVTGRPSLLLFSRPNVSYCCWGAPLLLFCCYC